MKKFFVILTALALLLSFSLPLFSVHAAENVWGHVSFEGDFDISGLKEIGVYTDDGSCVVTLLFKDNNGVSYDSIVISENGRFVRYSSGTTVLDVYYINSAGEGSWIDETAYKNITLLEPPSSEMIQWFENNGYMETPECDGTDCDWADDNFDQYCDTCGYALLNFRYDLLDYAYTFLNDSFTDHIYWVIVQDVAYPSGDTYYKLFKSRTPFKYANGLYTPDSDYLTASVMFGSDGVPVSEWWVTVDGDKEAVLGSDAVPVDVSHDINGFFPLPLHQMVEVVISQEVQTMMVKVMKVMMVLMISGVVCLASLIVLNLFGKRSLIYPKQ